MTASPRLMAVLAFAVTFAAGAASMSAIDRWSRRSQASVEPNGWGEVASRLDLTPAQREQVEQVFARYQPSTDAILTSLIPRLTAVSDSMQREIDALLTPDQRAELKALQRPATFLLRRKSPGGTRIDTLRIP